MWYQSSVFYQIYPFGFCGAPGQNDGVQANRIGKIAEWIPHLQALGTNAVYLCPIFDSDAHGYDTRDYQKLDTRLGSNEDFAAVCAALHQAGIRVVLDGVFNHVGRGFWAFRDVLEKREASPYKDWFYVNFGGNNGYNDGLYYEGWEGHYNLVKLNLGNPQVVQHLFSCIRGWAEQFDIDGLRLDVAYLLSEDFLRRLRAFCDGLKPDFFLIGETIHGDYNRIVNREMLHSCTNYECYKGLFSSFNDGNLFEIAYSLNRQFGAEAWTLYKGLPLLNFADNHDVSRIASQLTEARHLPLLYGLLLCMPGVPCLYYGSEWGAQGDKKDGDDALRAAFDAPAENELFETVAKMCHIRTASPALQTGGYRQCHLTSRQFIFERKTDTQRILLAINADNEPHTAHFDAGAGQAANLLQNGARVDFGGGLKMPPCSVQILEMER